MNVNNSEINSVARELSEMELAAAAGGFVATDDLWRKKGFLLDVLEVKPSSPLPGTTSFDGSSK